MKKKRVLPTKEMAERTPGRHEPTEEEIRRRAYELYLAKGGAPGHEVDDWLQAERELPSEYEDTE